MKRFFIVGGLIFIFCLGMSVEGRGEDLGEGAEKVLELVDTPTAHLYPKGEYGINLRIYNEGSVLLRFALSLTDYIMLGVPLDIRHFIGDREVEIELPPVIWARIRLTKKGGNLWPMAIGYDPTNYGKDEEEGKKVRGLYLVCTKPFYLRSLPMEWHLGINADLEDFEDRGICSFGGLNLSINPYLLFHAELEEVSFKGGDDPLFNLGLRYLASEHLDLEIDLRDVGSTEPDRLIRFGYSNRLF